MIIRTTLRLLMVLIFCSCHQQLSKKTLQIEGKPKQNLELSSSLTVENRINRGARYTDSKGIDYWLINIASTITNESTSPIQLNLTFSKDYRYPNEYGNQPFNIFLLPKVFALDNVTIVKDRAMLTDSMQVAFRNYIEGGGDNLYRFNKTLGPGEKCVIPIGTQYPGSFKCAVFPNVLLLQSDITNFQDCENLIAQDEANAQNLALGLKLDFRIGKTVEKCIIIPCGEISNTNQ